MASPIALLKCRRWARPNTEWRDRRSVFLQIMPEIAFPLRLPQNGLNALNNHLLVRYLPFVRELMDGSGLLVGQLDFCSYHVIAFTTIIAHPATPRDI